MSQAHLQSAQRRSGWQMILVALSVLSGPVVKEPQTDVLLQQVPVGQRGLRGVGRWRHAGIGVRRNHPGDSAQYISLRRLISSILPFDLGMFRSRALHW